MLTAKELFNLGLSNEQRGAIDRALHFYSSIIVHGRKKWRRTIGFR